MTFAGDEGRRPSCALDEDHVDMRVSLYDTIARNNFRPSCAREDELVISHHGQQAFCIVCRNVKPIMSHVTSATSETVIGDRVIRSIVNAAGGDAFLAQISEQPAAPLESKLPWWCEGPSPLALNAGMTFDVHDR